MKLRLRSLCPGNANLLIGRLRRATLEIGVPGIILLPILCVAPLLIFPGYRAPAAPATQPTTKPTTKPAVPSATATLFNGRIEYIPPADWKIQHSNLPGDIAAIYVAADEDGYFALQVLPENAVTTPDVAQKICLQLRMNHKKRGQAMDLAPVVEKDARFPIKIHERYKTKEGKTADETHMYRVIAGRAMELDVQSLSENADHIELVRKTGEDVLLSARWKKAGSKK